MQQQFDERNRDILINVNGELVHRDEARISPFDSVVQGGDAVWEGLRVYDGRIFKLEEHLERLRGSALALALHGGRDALADGLVRSPHRVGAEVAISFRRHGLRVPQKSAGHLQRHAARRRHRAERMP